MSITRTIKVALLLVAVIFTLSVTGETPSEPLGPGPQESYSPMKTVSKFMHQLNRSNYTGAFEYVAPSWKEIPDIDGEVMSFMFLIGDRHYILVHTAISYMEIISESDTQAVVLGHVVQNDGTYVAKIFSLSKMKKGENKNCWMVSDIENESMPEVLVPSPIYSPTNVQKIVLMYLRQNPPEGDLDGTENIALAYRFFKRDASSTFEPFAHSVQDHPILNQFERVKPMTIKSVNNMTTIESTIITRSGNEIRLEMGMVQATQRGCEDCWFVQILSIYGDDNAATHSFDSLDGSDKGLILRSLHIIRKHPILQLLAACIVVSCFVMAFLVTLRIAEVVADGVLGEQQRVSTMESPHSHYKYLRLDEERDSTLNRNIFTGVELTV